MKLEGLPIFSEELAATKPANTAKAPAALSASREPDEAEFEKF